MSKFMFAATSSSCRLLRIGGSRGRQQLPSRVAAPACATGCRSRSSTVAYIYDVVSAGAAPEARSPSPRAGRLARSKLRRPPRLSGRRRPPASSSKGTRRRRRDGGTRVPVLALRDRDGDLPPERKARSGYARARQSLVVKATLRQAWSGNSIPGPQCAFEMSMFMCPAVYTLTRN